MLSIIIPVYNSEKEITKCLESILKNNTSFEYEIILVNDGSTDNSLNILEKFSSNYENIKVFNQKNEGVSSARNLGISKASGEWIMFVDSDDFLSDGWSKIVERYLKSDNEFIIFSNNSHFETDRSKIIEMITGVVASQYMTCIWSKMYKTHIIKKYNIKFQYGIINGEDVIFNLEYYLKCKNIQFVKANIYNYYINNLSVTNSFNSKFIESDILYQCRLQNILESLEDNFDYICKVNILNAWLVFFNRYSYVKKYDYRDISSLVDDEKYAKVIKKYRDYIQYFSKSKKILLYLVYNKFYRLVYYLFKIKNKLIKKTKITIERI